MVGTCGECHGRLLHVLHCFAMCCRAFELEGSLSTPLLGQTMLPDPSLPFLNQSPKEVGVLKDVGCGGTAQLQLSKFAMQTRT